MRVDIPLRYDLYEGGYPVNPWVCCPSRRPGVSETIGGQLQPWGLTL